MQYQSGNKQDNFNDELSSLMTLKFQLFDKINSQNMAA